MKDNLFKDLSIREVDYSYEIDDESTLYESNGIVLHAERLIAEYAEVRAKLEDVGSPACMFLERTILITAVVYRLKPTAPSYGFAMISEVLS